MTSMNLNELLNAYPAPDADAGELMANALSGWDKKIIVLDDDPTGVQTVHDIPVYTAWDKQSVNSGFADDGMFFILTNSRGMPESEARTLNRDIARRVLAASRETGKDFVIISRSDSTLRGYYPLETAVLRETLEAEGGMRFDGEIICPFFIEGGRYTAGNIHYVLNGEILIPAGETEFARDKSFGYVNSDLTRWVEEKTNGECKAGDVVAVSIEMIRQGGANAVRDALSEHEGFVRIIVNALCYDDIRVFLAGYVLAVKAGRRFIFRSAAAIPKILGGVPDRPLLGREQLVAGNKNGGLVIIGSHVAKTTRQLEMLRDMDCVGFIEFDQHLVLDAPAFEKEIARVKELADRYIAQGRDTVIYTRRERLDMDSGGPEAELRLARSISGAITSFVSDLKIQPSYIIAKGGITSSDIGTVGLRARRAMVMGQVLPGIPVWRLGDESKFPGMAYIIFPGNVGGDDALRVIVSKLGR